MAETSYPTSEVRGGGTNYPTPKVRGGGMNYLMLEVNTAFSYLEPVCCSMS